MTRRQMDMANLPDINEHSLARLGLGLSNGKGIDDFSPTLTDAERIWYEALKEDQEKFEKEHPGAEPIWDIPTSYE